MTHTTVHQHTDCVRDADLWVGDMVQFNFKQQNWRVRATACDGRYVICTTNAFGKVLYTIVDNTTGRRGAMNVIGHGLGINTTSGPDAAIDEAVEMLEETGSVWELSHRNNVELCITRVRRS